LGGTIRVDSSVGQGTVFVLDLPLGVAAGRVSGQEAPTGIETTR
jgi:hypothetical protein